MRSYNDAAAKRAIRSRRLRGQPSFDVSTRRCRPRHAHTRTCIHLSSSLVPIIVYQVEPVSRNAVTGSNEIVFQFRTEKEQKKKYKTVRVMEKIKKISLYTRLTVSEFRRGRR
jgi:hypothetical protein